MSVNRYDAMRPSSPGAASATHGFLVAAPAPACTSACCGAPPLTAASLAAHLRAVLGADTQRASVQQRDAAAATTGVTAAEIVETCRKALSPRSTTVERECGARCSAPLQACSPAQRATCVSIFCSHTFCACVFMLTGYCVLEELQTSVNDICCCMRHRPVHCT